MSVDLDELQGEAEKLLALLKDRQPGLSTWNSFVAQQIRALQRLTTEALEDPAESDSPVNMATTIAQVSPHGYVIQRGKAR